MISFETVEKMLREYVRDATGLADTKVYWEGDHPDGDRPAAPCISLNLPSIQRRGRDWRKRVDRPMTYTPKAISAVGVSPANTLTITAHGLETGDGPHNAASDGTMIGGLVALDPYWSIKVDANTIKLAASFMDARNGIPVALTSAGTGNRTLEAIAATRKAGQEITVKSQGVRTVHFSIQCFGATAVKDAGARALLAKCIDQYNLPSFRARFRAAKVGLSEFGQIRVAGGVINSTIFEPRAVLDVTLFLASEVEEPQSYFERMSMTSPDLDRTVKVE